MSWGAWGQGWRWLLLLLVHLLEVLLPGRVSLRLQLLHVEGLPVGQELLPLVLQLPGRRRAVTRGQETPKAHTLPPALSSDKPSLPILAIPTPNLSPVAAAVLASSPSPVPPPGLLAAHMASHCSGQVDLIWW